MRIWDARLRMLAFDRLAAQDGVTVDDVVCGCGRGEATETEVSGWHALVLVRRGCFRRTADGRRELLDPTVGYWMTPGQEQRYDHPHDGGDACTAIGLSLQLAASLWGGEPGPPGGLVRVPPALDVAHRRLLAAARRPGSDVAEAALELCAAALEQAEPARVASGLPAAERERATLVAAAREALAADPGRSLTSLADELAVSPHHLSRIFRAGTGATVSRYKMRLRARDALERLAGGERDLARLAADAGFADQSHLCRVLRAEAGTTPSALRAAL